MSKGEEVSMEDVLNNPTEEQIRLTEAVNNSTYVLGLQNAIRELCHESVSQQEQIQKLEALFAMAQQEIEERDEAILELDTKLQEANKLIKQQQKLLYGKQTK